MHLCCFGYAYVYAFAYVCMITHLCYAEHPQSCLCRVLATWLSTAEFCCLQKAYVVHFMTSDSTGEHVFNAAVT